MSPDWHTMHQLDSQTLATTSEPIDRWADTYIPGEDRLAVLAAIDDGMRTKSLIELEHRVRLADGGVGWVLSRAVPMLGPDGAITEWFGTVSDVTERRVMADALRAREQRHRDELEDEVRARTAELKRSRDLLQATIDSSFDTIQVFEAVRNAAGAIVDFRWILSNHASEARYGNVIGERLLTRNPGVLEEGIFDTFRDVVDTGRSAHAERRDTHEPFDGWFLQSVVRLGDGVATTTKDISAWKAAQADVLRLQEEVARSRLRESEERLRRFGEASQDVLWIRDADTLQWEYLTPAFEAIYGLSREEALTGNHFRSWLDLIVADDREHAEAMIARVWAGEHVSFEYRIKRPSDGALRWLRSTDFPIVDAGGKVTLVGGIGEDITDARMSQRRLERSEERLRSAVEVGRVGLWDWNVSTGEIHWSNEHFRMEGYAVGEVTPSYETWASRLHPDDRAATEAALHRAMTLHEDYAREFRVVHPDGLTHWLYGRGRFFYDDSGAPLRMIGAMVDTTERREWEERQKVLVAELQHRTFNLMGMIRSMADSTLRSSEDLDAFRPKFRERIGALARVQRLLSRLTEDEQVTFDALIHGELEAVGALPGEDTRVALSGPPDVALRSSTVQTFAMALHELTTNAVIYGALSQPGARLDVRWHVEPEADGEPWLHVVWQESGVAMPPADSRPQGTGQGRNLIEGALPYQLRARTTYVMAPDGVRCSIAMRVSSKAKAEAASGVD